MNYTLLAYVFVVVMVVLFSLTLPLEMYPLRKEPREKAVALDYILVVNALAYASRHPEDPAVHFQEMLNQGYNMLDGKVITKPEIVEVSFVFNSNAILGNVTFKHPWGNETIVAYLAAEATMIARKVSTKLALRLYLVLLRVKSDRPVSTKISVKNAYLLMIERLPDQCFLIKLLVPKGESPVIQIIDERNILLEVSL